MSHGRPHSAAAAALALAAGEPIHRRVALVVAHADDETLWAGSALPRLPDLLLIHATDGAPLDMHDAHALGIVDRARYAALRTAELDRALEALAVAPQRLAYAIPDQELVLRLPDLIERLVRDLTGVRLVVTHPYEGGHPDHDALALAVRVACDRIGATTGAEPPIVEFACYHELDGERRFGEFWPDANVPEQTRALSESDRARVDAAIRAHASQAGVVAGWRPQVERWRAAPRYVFSAPPPPGRALYDRFGWAMTSARWRTIAADVLEPGAR